MASDNPILPLKPGGSGKARRSSRLPHPVRTPYSPERSRFRKILRFHKGYFLISAGLVVIEVCIGAYAHDDIIRPYGGDFLCVILIYCGVMTVANFPMLPTILSVLAFAYIEETLQYFHIADWLGLKEGSLARILVGTYFTWGDIGAYTLAMGLVLLIEWLRRRGCSLQTLL
ncbi:MAG: DUF2809 domain-containing protein [Puia sp.]|nr:DUF2809 domain-containing protein [Puia sp.]